MIKLVITDLDDTLYSWIGFFVPSFYDMISELSELIDVSKEQLLEEYKLIHQTLKSVEFPYATLQLPAVNKKYGDLPEEEILAQLNPAFHRFNSTRKKLLKLYPYVEETLRFLVENNIPVVGYTESSEENGFYRLKKLGIEHYFKDVFISESSYVHPNSYPSSLKTHVVAAKKPNPELIKQICRDEDISVENTIYIGDSITKDMLMAKKAGVLSVWCNISADDTKDLYDKLVRISHWSAEDFEQEQKNRKQWEEKGHSPDFTIQSFNELESIIKKLNNLQ